MDRFTSLADRLLRLLAADNGFLSVDDLLGDEGEIRVRVGGLLQKMEDSGALLDESSLDEIANNPEEAEELYGEYEGYQELSEVLDSLTG